MRHAVRKPNLWSGSLSWVGCDQSVLLCISGAKSSRQERSWKKPCSQNQTIWLSAGCSWLSCPQPVLQRLAALVSTGQDRHYLAFRNAHERKPHATINIICNLSLNQSHLTRSQFGLDMVFSVYLISAKLRNLSHSLNSFAIHSPDPFCLWTQVFTIYSNTEKRKERMGKWRTEGARGEKQSGSHPSEVQLAAVWRVCVCVRAGHSAAPAAPVMEHCQEEAGKQREGV